MVTVYDVDAQGLIRRVAEKLKEKVKVPEFLYFVKTGAHRERPPDDPEAFWYGRLASILRRAYIEGTVGVSKLARHYGGRKNRGVKPEHFHPAGRKIIRVALQELEKAGYLTKGANGKGRVITPQGQSLLDNTAYELWKELHGREGAKGKARAGKPKEKAEGEKKAGKKPKAEGKKAKPEKEKAEKAKEEKEEKGRKKAGRAKAEKAEKKGKAKKAKKASSKTKE